MSRYAILRYHGRVPQISIEKQVIITVTFMKFNFFIALCLAVVCISACEFDNPYVPDHAGSSTLTGRVVTDPVMDVAGAEVLLRGQDSFATIADPDGTFHFRNVPPGDYSLQVQKKPYLQDSLPVQIRKSTDEDIGDVSFQLGGAIAGTIPNSDIAIVSGEVEVIVYIDGIPMVLQEDGEGDLTIELSSTESTISVQAATKITVYIDKVPYSATVLDEGNFVVEFVPPGIYSDIRVKPNSEEDTIPVASGGPVVVKSGQTRLLPPVP